MSIRSFDLYGISKIPHNSESIGLFIIFLSKFNIFLSVFFKNIIKFKIKDIYLLVLYQQNILMLEGLFDADEALLANQHRLSLVIHQTEQITILDALSLPHPFEVFVKINTGMNRLGFQPQQLVALIMPEDHFRWIFSLALFHTGATIISYTNPDNIDYIIRNVIN